MRRTLFVCVVHIQSHICNSRDRESSRNGLGLRAPELLVTDMISSPPHQGLLLARARRPNIHTEFLKYIPVMVLINQLDVAFLTRCVLLSMHLQSQIRKIRDRESSLRMGVPDDALDGHAFHTYTVTSADNSVEFVFKHNVTGRSIYAEGTVDAVLFLAKQMQENAEQKVYNMIDVLKAGYLR